MLHEALDDMPEFRDPNSGVWVWDSESHSYVLKPDSGLEQDRGHATGGDNDLFNQNQIEHSELAGVPELEGYMASLDPIDPAYYFRCDCGNRFDPYEHNYACPACGEKIELDESRREPSIEDTYPDWEQELDTVHLPGRIPNNSYLSAEWAPPGEVMCPQCQEPTDQPACPQCSKNLTPEWNQESDKNNEFFGVPDQHDDASEFTSWPDRVPKRNREKTDDSYPSMSLSKIMAGWLTLAVDGNSWLPTLPENEEDEREVWKNRLPFLVWPNGKYLIGQPGQIHEDLHRTYPQYGEMRAENQGHLQLAPEGWSVIPQWPVSTDSMETPPWLTDEQRNAVLMMGKRRFRRTNQTHRVSSITFKSATLSTLSIGSLRMPTFSHIDEELAWREANGASLDSCPECDDVMHDQDGEKACHSCGHKQPIIIHRGAVLAPLGEAAFGGLAEAGGGAAAAGGAGGLSGVGDLMTRALNPSSALGRGTMWGAGREIGKDAVGGDSQAPAPSDGTSYEDLSQGQGVISKVQIHKEAGIWGSIIENLVQMLQKAPEALTDPKSPLSYADDVAGLASGMNTNNGGYMAHVIPDDELWGFKIADTFGEEETGRATKNNGENSDPDHEGSGDSFEEKGDSPELLKDVDGPGDAKGDAFPQDDLKNQGDPAFQEKALKSLHMNLPLVIEFANSDEAGSENPILMALDSMLEEAFPGYKDGHEPAAETTEHPMDESDDESEDESGEKPEDGDSSNGEEKPEEEKKSDPKEASLWHFALDQPEREAAIKESFGEAMAPAALPGAMPTMPAPANTLTAPVCPMCGQTHAPGTACPSANTQQQQVVAPAATGIAPAAMQSGPTKVVTKWQVVTFEAANTCEQCGNLVQGQHCPWCGHANQQGADFHNPQFADHFEQSGNQVQDLDPHFAFFAFSDEHHHQEHEVEHTPDGGGDAGVDMTGDDGSGSDWTDETGTPLQEGVEYEMKSGSYAIPDRVTIDRVLPDKLVYTIHTGDVDYQDEVSRQQLDLDGVTFAAVGGGEAPYDSEDGFQDYEAPVRPGQDASPQVDDLTTPSTVVSKGVVQRDVVPLDAYTGSFSGDAPDARTWLMEDSSPVAVDPSLMAKLAGKDFSPREQREFIDERGEARNLDRLQLEGTHYVIDDTDDQFNWV